MLFKKLKILFVFVLVTIKSFTQENSTCLYFDGKASHVALSTNPKIELDSGTVEIWIKNNDTANMEWQAIVSKTLSFQIALYKDSVASYDWKNKEVFNFHPKINDNQWHHIALIFRKDVVNGSQLFVDGNAIGTPFTYQFLYKGSELQIGANNYEPQYFKGYMDDFRLWNTPRTQQQIQKNYLQELIGTEQGLVVYYKFNDGKPFANNQNIIYLKDETNNGFNGKLVDFSLKDSISNFVNQSPVKPASSNVLLAFIRKNYVNILFVLIIVAIASFIFYLRIFYLKKRNIALNNLVLLRTQELKETIHQKDYLLQEVHHRVKNNLQMISTMLQLEMENDRTEEQQKPLLETARRLQCMSLVHEQLYRVENLEKINAKQYIETLVTNINEMVNAENKTIAFTLNIASVDLLITKCLPIGFIISEMVSNAIQHAFSNTSNHAQIAIILVEKEKDFFQLIVKDNGVGVSIENLSEIKNRQFTTSLGLRLVEVFANQLDAKISFIVNDGFGVNLNFKI
jgi:two-component sensor histidine kinase